MSTPPLLHLENVSLSFSGLKAVTGFGLELRPGDLHGLIGPNGAGKTTVFNLVTGIYRPDSGRIDLAGRSLTGLPAWKIARRGVTRTFQNVRLFKDLTVLDNVRQACHLRARHTFPETVLRMGRFFAGERAITDRARELLGVMGLADRERELARNLPYGDQRRLEIARALATGPKVLLLDEPAAGMNASEKVALASLIRELGKRFDVTILLIDHDMGLVMSICERITVLDHGQVIAHGTPGEIQNDPNVIEAYLGEPLNTGD